MTDTLSLATGPALSVSGSEFPEVVKKAVPPPPVASNDETDQQDGKAAEQPPEQQARPAEEAAPPEATETAPEPPKVPKGVQKRLDELTGQRRAAEERAARLEARLGQALTALEKLSVPPTQPQSTISPQEPIEPKPARDQFEDPSAYDEALIAWSARQATRIATAEAERANAERARAEAEAKAKADAEATWNARIETWSGRRAKAIEEMPDYVEIAENPNVSISAAMAHAIMETDNGPSVAYHLGKNPDEAKRIAEMRPEQQFMAIARLSEKLEADAKPSVSKAPPPVKPIGSNAAALPKSPDEETMEEYAARRNRELAALRKPFLPGVKPN